MKMLNTQSLKAYINHRGAAFQPINHLLEARVKETARAKHFISSQITDCNWNVLTKEQAFELGFEELAGWAIESDYIIAIELVKPINDEYYISICFPKNDFEQIES